MDPETMENDSNLESQVLRRWYHEMEANVDFFDDRWPIAAGPCVKQKHTSVC